MGLQIRKQANVDGTFLALAFSIYRNWWDAEMESAKMHPMGEAAFLEQNRLFYARVHNLLSGGDGDGRSGKSYESTLLRSFPFTDYRALRHDGINYLVGETRPIIIDMPSSRNSRRVPGGQYHLGPYRIFIAESVILQGNIDAIHMIPLKAPETTNRFMHHRAISRGASHPLSYGTSTCWGNSGFGAYIKNCAASAHIPNLFRSLHQFLTRYDVNSPLVSINQMGWDVKTPWEEWNANRTSA